MPLEQFPVTGKLNRACSAVFLGKNGHQCRSFAIHLQEICFSPQDTKANPYLFLDTKALFISVVPPSRQDLENIKAPAKPTFPYTGPRILIYHEIRLINEIKRNILCQQARP